MNYLKTIAFTLATAGALIASTSNAALLDEGNGQLYDDVTGLVWQQNANLAATNTFGVSGITTGGTMDWPTAQSWIAAMNAADYLGHQDWELPTTSPVNGTSFNFTPSYDGSTDAAFNIKSTVSPLSYMYYVNLGLLGYFDSSGTPQSNWGVFSDGTYGGQVNVGLVQNLQSYVYWSGTLYSDQVVLFDTAYGSEGINLPNIAFSAWAVRPANAGDIAAAVPEPETYAMLLAGLGLLGFVGRRRKS